MGKNGFVFVYLFFFPFKENMWRDSITRSTELYMRLIIMERMSDKERTVYY